jgi:type II secretory pathway component GspD/PulD (secretin)
LVIGRLLSTFGACLLCAGCATAERFATEVKTRIDRNAGEVVIERAAPVLVRSDSGNRISAIPVNYVAPVRGVVTLKASELPLATAIAGIAQTAGISVSYQQGADPQKPVSVDLREVDAQTAIREVAYAAGFVAVFERPQTVTIAREATLTFRVPARVLKTLHARYAISGGSQSGGSSPTSSAIGAPTAAGSSGTGSNAASVSVSGTSLQDATGLKTFLQTMSGAEPSILAEEGLVAARGNSAQLRRLQSFLDQYVRENLAQVEVELSVLEVSLASEFSSGIDWKRVLPVESLLGTSVVVDLQARRDFPTGAFSVQSTSRSIESVVRALEQYTTVHELTRPRVVAMNHAHTLYRASIQRPYLPTASSNVTTGGSATTVQSSASVSYSEDGITFAVQAHVLDSHRVELTIVPVLTATQRIETFQISRDVTLSAPVQPRQDAHLQVLAEHGRTMVIGGLRSSSGVDRASGVPGAVRVPGLNLILGGRHDNTSAREIVMLLHARIVPAARISTLIGESI